MIPQYLAASPAYSNYFSRANIVSSNTNVGFVLINNNAARFRPNFAEVSLTDWRTWLSSHNILLYYIVASTDTKITDATLISELEAVLALSPYAGQTNIAITASGNNLPAILEITAINANAKGIIERMRA